MSDECYSYSSNGQKFKAATLKSIYVTKVSSKSVGVNSDAKNVEV